MSWWNLSYKKRIKYTITLTSGEIAQNQAIPLLIAEKIGGDIDLEGYSNKFPGTKNDGGDLAVIDNDDITQLNFWIEEVIGNTPNRIAKCWVKIPVAYISGNSFSFYIYFSNSNANNLSNGDNTFNLFDDFDGTSLDTTKWSIYAGAPTVSNSILTLTNGDRINSISTFAPGRCAYFRSQIYSWGNYGACSHGFMDYANYPDESVYIGANGPAYTNYPDFYLRTSEGGSANLVNTGLAKDLNWHKHSIFWINPSPDLAKAHIDDNYDTTSNLYVTALNNPVFIFTRPNYTETFKVDYVFVFPYKENTYTSTQGNIENAPPSPYIGLKRIKLLKMGLLKA